MEEQEIEAIKTELVKSGFDARLVTQLNADDLYKDGYFELHERVLYGKEVVNYKIHFKLNEQNRHYEIQQFDISLRREMLLPDRVIHGISVHALDGRMSQVDWFNFAKKAHDDEFRRQVWEIYQDLWTLSFNSHPTGTDVQEKLILKYLADTPEAEEIANLDKIQARHEVQRTFDNNSPVRFNARQAYNLLSGRFVAAGIKQGMESDTKWFRMDPLARDFTAMPVIVALEGSERFDLEKLMDRLELGGESGHLKKEELLKSLMDGDQVLVTGIVAGVEKQSIIVADPTGNRIKTDLHEMVNRGLLESITVDQAITRQIPENEALIENVLGQMDRLGLGKIDEKAIREMVFNEAEFLRLGYQRKFGDDLVSYQVNIERNENFGGYYISHVDASLKKSIAVPVSILTLDRQMAQVNWGVDYYEAHARAERLLDIVLGSNQREADDILDRLAKVNDVAGGRTRFRDLLEWKHWGGTPNEKYILDLFAVKTKYEISHRFDMQSTPEVDANDMYHLLDGRAVEKMLPDGFMEGQVTTAYLTLFQSNNASSLNKIYSMSLVDFFSTVDPWPISVEGRNLDKIAEKLSSGEIADVELNIEGEVRKVRVSWDPLSMNMLSWHKDTNPVDSFRNGDVFNLINDLEKFGFAGFDKYVMRDVMNGLPVFNLRADWEDLDDRAQFEIRIEGPVGQEKYELRSLGVSLLKSIQVPTDFIGEMDIAELEWQMENLNWKEKDYWQLGEPYLPNAEGEVNKQVLAMAVFEGLDTLMSSMDKKAIWVAEALSMQHFRNTPNEYYIVQLARLKDQYEIAHKFELRNDNWLTLRKAYNLVDGRSVVIDDTKDTRWAKLNFRDTSQNAHLQEFSGKEPLDIKEILKINPGLNDVTIAQIETRLKEGYIFTAGFPFEGKNNLISFYADPEKRKLIFTNTEDKSQLNRFLLDTGMWEYKENIKRGIGQRRDYGVHPILVHEANYNDLRQKMWEVGFGEGHDRELREKLQIAYPEFTIGHTESFGEKPAKASIHIIQSPDSGLFELNRFDLQLSQGDHSPLMAFFECYRYTEAPVFDFREAVNLLDGRMVCKRDENKRENPENWYWLDLDQVQPNGRYPIKVMQTSEFNVETRLSQYSVEELKESGTKAALLTALRKGDIAAVTLAGKDGQKTYYISVDIKKGGFEFHQGLSARQEPFDEKKRGKRR